MSEPSKTFLYLRRVLLLGWLGLAINFAQRGFFRALKRRDELAAFFGGFTDVGLGLAGLALLALAGTVLALLVLWKKGRTPEGSLRLAVYCAALALGLQLAFLQPYDKTRFYLAWAWAGLGFAALFWVRAKVPARLRKVGDVLCANVVFLALGLEILLRCFALVSPSPLFVQSGSDLLATYQLRPGTQRFGFPINAAGHFDEPFAQAAPGETLVAAIGDSFSTGIVPHSHHFTTLCEDSTFTVANIGAPALGPAEYLRLLERDAQPLAPAAISVQLFAGNDVIGYPEEDWRRSVGMRENILLWQVPRRILTARATQAASGKDAEPSLAFLDDPALEVPTFTPGEHFRIERTRARDNCDPAAEDRYAELFEVLEDLLADAGDTPLGFVLIPDEFQLDDALWERILEVHPGLERDLPQRKIGAWAEERGVPLLDLLPALRAVPPLEDGSRHLYHLRDTHFNARGNRATAEQLGPFLRRLARGTG